ncbi:MAG: hypothetical protein HYR88_09015 [Verrucomicrobia bacterium]|nr:hypothetical protein [Verrucomicrobiota bacterium]
MADYKYDPFGRTISSSGALAAANTYRFSSKELMTVSGFYYYGYRFYDPVTQRWLNREPIQERGGVNLYAFVGNNSTDKYDLDGRCIGELAGAIKALCSLYPNTPGCAMVPKSVGGMLTGDATVGNGGFSGHGELSVGGGLFPSGPGGFLSYGFSGGPFGGWSAQNPGSNWNQSQNLNPALGVNAAAGLAGWISNAQHPSDLGRTIRTISLNTGLGVKWGSLQFSYGHGIYQFGFGPPVAGIGGGLSATCQNTTTKTIGD